MKRIILLVCILWIALLNPIGIFAQKTDQEGAKSVVKISTTFKGPDENGKIVTKVGNGTGWCWNKSNQVVTALHVVAGIPDKDIKVYTDKESKSSGAKVLKVLKEADLALLQLDSDLGLTPLTLASVEPNSKSEFYIWGFPHGVFQMAGDDIRFSRSLDSDPTLNSIVNKTDFKFTLEKQQYPLPKSLILRVSSIIQPGHSGAPIFSSTGQVIGVADGGLREGTARLNWAFPASLYVPKLLNSGDIIPNTLSLQSNLYSSYTVVPDNATAEEQNQIIEKEVMENVVGSGDQTINKSWTASYDEIFETLNEDDKSDLAAITSENGLNMRNTWYDVYEDYNTGATITIPAGEDMVFDNGWFYVNNDDYSLHYSALIFAAGSFENAKNSALNVFQQVLESKAYVQDPSYWVAKEDSPDHATQDEDYEMASLYYTRYANDGSDKMLIFNAEVDGPDLLVVLLVCDLNKMQDANYQKQFLHYSVALNLAAFAGY